MKVQGHIREQGLYRTLDALRIFVELPIAHILPPQANRTPNKPPYEVSSGFTGSMWSRTSKPHSEISAVDRSRHQYPRLRPPAGLALALPGERVRGLADRGSA